MAPFDLLVKALDDAHWEMTEAFKGLPDADVWRRAHPRLLSVGELAAHVSFGEAQSFLGDDGLESPLFVPVAAYYTANVDAPLTLPMSADAVLSEVERIHVRCQEAFASDSPVLEGPNPHRDGWTWAYTFEYQAFHVAYHTGQIYSVRHLMGHSTTDN